MQRQLRTSERVSFKRCLWQWEKNYVEKLEPVRASTALRFGTLIHKALELAYPSQLNERHITHTPADIFADLMDAERDKIFGITDEDGTFSDARELGIAMLEGYVAKYRGDSDEWEVIATEYAFDYPINDRWTYVGKIDSIRRYLVDGGIYLWDYKTAKTIETEYLELDEQANGYWAYGLWALERDGIIKSQKEVRGLIFDFLRKAKPDDRAINEFGQTVNKDGSPSKRQPSPLFLRVPTYRSPFQRQALQARLDSETAAMDYVHETLDNQDDYEYNPIYKTPGKENCRMCAFKDACLLDEQGGDVQMYLDSTMKTWNPYEEYEK